VIQNSSSRTSSSWIYFRIPLVWHWLFELLKRVQHDTIVTPNLFRDLVSVALTVSGSLNCGTYCLSCWNEFSMTAATFVIQNSSSRTCFGILWVWLLRFQDPISVALTAWGAETSSAWHHRHP
jgi:hypothetical protein